MILHLLRMRRNVNRKVYNDRKKCKRDSAIEGLSLVCHGNNDSVIWQCILCFEENNLFNVTKDFR